ncbi:ABC transporter permease [Mycoplasmatota bacterium]|nr:ABC transporter permease [Mycoplasmatota bacterium]
MIIINVLEQGFIFALLALGVYITYKILDFPDLTVDGSIVLGASVTGMLITKNFDPLTLTVFSVFSGLIAGFLTGIIHVYLKISHLLSGILIMISLYSINLRIMNSPNINFFQYDTIFNHFWIKNKLIILGVVVLLVKLLLDLFLKTKLGMLLKITGDNPQLITSLGIDIGKMKIFGLMISNGLVALSGSLLAQYQRFSDINSGAGTIVIGLAAVIIGQALFKFKFIFIKDTTAVILGAITYKLIQAYTLQLGLLANDFKLITALIIILILGLHHFKSNLKGSDVKC